MKVQWLKYHTREQLLNSINQIDVWGMILGHKVELGQYILNPLRSDFNAGSCYLSEWKGKIVLTDWANFKYSGYDCISAYIELNPHKKWQEITIDLLKCGSYQNYIPLIQRRKKTLDLKPIYKDWTEQELEWWLQRGVTKEQMNRKETLIRPIKGYLHKKEGKEMTVYLSEPAYCYHHKGRYKFYFPTRKENRFLGNQGRDDIWFLEKAETKILLISKCHKDLLCLENLVPYSLTHVQGENYGHPTDLQVYEWEVKFEQIYILFDGDNSGIEGMKRLKNRFVYASCDYFWITEPGIKDVCDMRLHFGEQETIDYLIELFK